MRRPSASASNPSTHTAMRPTPTLLVLASALALSACVTVGQPEAPPVGALGAGGVPVSFDGHVAARPTDIVFSVVSDGNPATPGLELAVGETLRLGLPTAFQRNPVVSITPDADSNLVMTKGWPQGSIRLAGQYRVGYEQARHAMTVTALQPIGRDGANAPGIKAIHVRGATFTNPVAGEYPVSLTHVGADGREIAVWQGRVNVIAVAPPARLAPTNFHLAPGSNANFQQVRPGESAPHDLGLLLWGAQGAPMNGVGVAPRDLAAHPKYTGGLLVQDTNGDGRLDAKVDRVVGGIIGAAPEGAQGQAASSPIVGGKPLLSGQVPRDAAYPPAAGGGKPNPGLLAIAFKAGDKPGLYQPTIELIGGNSFRYTVIAR